MFYEADDASIDEETPNDNYIVKTTNTLQPKKNEFYDPIYSTTTKRTKLPKERIDLNLNVWSILKDAVGKDLNKFCVPGNFLTKYTSMNLFLCFKDFAKICSIVTF